MDPPRESCFHQIHLTIGILVTVVNIFQIIVIWKTKKLNIPSIFILNLSISDLLVGLFVVIHSSINYSPHTFSDKVQEQLMKYGTTANPTGITTLEKL